MLTSVRIIFSQNSFANFMYELWWTRELSHFCCMYIMFELPLIRWNVRINISWRFSWQNTYKKVTRSWKCYAQKFYNKLDFANINNDIISGCAISQYTIQRFTIHDSWVNYPNHLKLCKENHATGKLNFAEQNT